MHTIEELIESRPGAEGIQPASLERAVAINDFIYLSSGTSNAYMVVTDAGRVIINTGMGFESITHKRVFDAVCPGPTPFILLTQGHVDHVGGVKNFRQPETRVLAQANNPSCQRDDERVKDLRQSQSYVWFSHVIDEAIKLAETNPEVFEQDVPQADILFDDHYRFSLGGVDFELFATPGGETIDSCVVWLPQHKIAFTGNTFGPLFPHFPNLNTVRGDKYRYVEPYLAAVARVRTLEPEMLVTGHFEPIVGAGLIRQCLDRLHGAVDYVHQQTLQGMNSGIDVWSLMQQIQLPPELKVGEGYGMVRWGVRTIWESTMGWFHLRSTAELYAQQPSSIYAELADLAGVDNIVARAEGLLGEGLAVEALHMAQVALAQQPDHREALELSLDAHRRLMAQDGHNFWARGWLQTEIGKLESRLQQ